MGADAHARVRLRKGKRKRGDREREREKRGRRLRGKKGAGAMLEARTNMEKVERMGTKSRGRMERGENEKKFAQTNSGDRKSVV